MKLYERKNKFLVHKAGLDIVQSVMMISFEDVAYTYRKHES